MGKWKKRLRKFAKKAAPLAMLGLGVAALAKRRKAKALNAITAGDVDTRTLSGKAGDEGMDYLAPAVTKNWITKKSDSVIVPQKKVDTEVDTESVPIGKMAGAGTAEQKIANQIKRGNFAQRNRGITINPHDVTAKAGALYNPYRKTRLRAKGGSAYKSGGRVGVGKAKRGFSKILRKK